MKRFVVLAVALTGLSLALSASAAPTPTLTIQHVVKGCHSWALNGGALKVSQHVQITRGGSLVVRNNDVMPHTLVQVSGPKAPVAGKVLMKHMGASVKVAFPAKGTYTFTTRAGEDYMAGVKTMGEDHVLKLTVTVS